MQSNVDFAKELEPVAREALLTTIDTAPVLVHLDYLLDNTSIHVITSAGIEDLNLPFDMLYQIK